MMIMTIVVYWASVKIQKSRNQTKTYTSVLTSTMDLCIYRSMPQRRRS